MLHCNYWMSIPNISSTSKAFQRSIYLQCFLLCNRNEKKGFSGAQKLLLLKASSGECWETIYNFTVTVTEGTVVVMLPM